MSAEIIPETSTTILVVDDNPTNLSLLFDLLSDEGFKVLVATDGEGAIAQVGYIKPDMLLLDVMMPGIDGFETCRRLKANDLTQDIPVIFMTALSAISDKVKGFDVGAVDYITKPIDREEVLARLKTHLTIRKLQKTLQNQNLALQKEISDRIAAESALRIFLHAVSHDLRNPVMAMLMLLRHLLRGVTTGHLGQSNHPLTEVKETAIASKSAIVPKSTLEKMAQSTERQLNLINSLLESHTNDIKGIVLHRHPHVLSQLVEGVISDLEPLLDENRATFTLAIASNLPLVLIDPTQVCRVWQNLISNALKHNPPGLHLTIDATIYDTSSENNQNADILLRPEASASESPLSPMLLCRITDNGIGMTPAQCQNLFNLYVQVNQPQQTLGLGLGLYICRQIITAHGGEIGVDSKPNVGSQFWFTLPIA
jgi:two-component system, sensor histidine kinase and response regulator